MTQKSNASKANGKSTSNPDVEKLMTQNEALLKRLEELEKKEAEKPKSYEEQLQFFEYQQQVITHLRKFEEKQEVIREANQKVKEKTDNGDFDTKFYRLSLVSINGETKHVFDITNPIIISKTLDSVSTEVETKIGELKGQLKL